jgi:hypothetical protein
MSLGIDGLFTGSETLLVPLTLDDDGEKLFLWGLWIMEKAWWWLRIYWRGCMITWMEPSVIETLTREFCILKPKNAKTSKHQPTFLWPFM